MVQCLGVFSGDVEPIKTSSETPVPHMGWNQIDPSQQCHPLLRGVQKGDYVYFVDSFAVATVTYTLAITDYGGRVMSNAGERNFFGCQFHPERSGAVGRRILENFIGM